MSVFIRANGTMECDRSHQQEVETQNISKTNTTSAGHGSKDSDSLRNDEPASDDEESFPSMAAMSKRKRKKLEQQMRKKQYLKEKRQSERQRKKQRLRDAKAQGTYCGPSRKALKLNTMAKSKCKIQVAVDCSFDDLMTEKDIKSIVKQINFCYASNRRAEEPLQFYVTSFNKRLKESMQAIGDYTKWDVHLDENCFEDIFPKDKVIYLSSDSKNILETLKEDKVYIIGGLVDHNHHKGICLKLAKEKGLAHAQLPIGDYILLESRKVLAINHVFDILLKYTETQSWKEAFYKVIPQRKIVPSKDMEQAAEGRPVIEKSALQGDQQSADLVHQTDDAKANHELEGIMETKQTSSDR